MKDEFSNEPLSAGSAMTNTERSLATARLQKSIPAISIANSYSNCNSSGRNDTTKYILVLLGRLLATTLDESMDRTADHLLDAT